MMVLTHQLCRNSLFSSTQVVMIIKNGPPFIFPLFFLSICKQLVFSSLSLPIKTVHQKFNLNENHENTSETVLVGWIMSCSKVHEQHMYILNNVEMPFIKLIFQSCYYKTVPLHIYIIIQTYIHSFTQLWIFWKKLLIELISFHNLSV